jgi:hypothetical protein
MRVFNPFKNSPQSLVFVALLVVLCIGYNKGRSDDKIRVSVNQFERSRMMARMWVAREQLKFSELAPPAMTSSSSCKSGRMSARLLPRSRQPGIERLRQTLSSSGRWSVLIARTT